MDWQEALTQYSTAFINGLVQSDVSEVVISPGSRSTPLAMLFQESPTVKAYMNIDERSAAFFALGMAKASRKPVALLCTSGTAAANYYPAIVEASLSRIPLVVITADRPHELRDVGAPQAIDQLHLYGGHVRWFTEMAIPEGSAQMLKYARKVGRRAASTACGQLAGPVHVNIPFREPLTPRISPSPFAEDKASADTAMPPSMIRGRLGLQEDEYDAVANLLQSREKGLIICGNFEEEGFGQAIIELAEKTGYPVCADPLSQLRSNGKKNEPVIDCYDSFLRADLAKKHLKPDIVLYFGQAPVSKALSLFLKENIAADHMFIDGGGGWRDPSHVSTHIIHCHEVVFCNHVALRLDHRNRTAWMDMWKNANSVAKHSIDAFMSDIQTIEEGKAVQELAGILPPESTVFIGNSMPIRDMDTFFRSGANAIRLLGNRGANGIDGVISTALGAALHERPLYLLIGDLSFFHDMNGLLAAKLHHINISIILLNNDGGGIFSHLPQAEEGNHFETLFGTPTGLNYEHAALLYGGQYTRIYDWEGFSVAIREAASYEGLSIIEVPTDREKNLLSHRALWKQVSQEINIFFEEVEI